MRTALRLEFLKSKRRGLMLTTLLLVGFEVLWIYMAFRNPSANEIQIGWMELLYQVPALNSIILPVTAAVIASRLADVEHKGETWKLLETIQRTECFVPCEVFVRNMVFAVVHSAFNRLYAGLRQGTWICRGAESWEISAVFCISAVRCLGNLCGAAYPVGSGTQPDDSALYWLRRCIYRTFAPVRSTKTAAISVALGTCQLALPSLYGQLAA